MSKDNKNKNPLLKQWPLLAGGVLTASALTLILWGAWSATHPAPVPLVGMVDADTISVAAKIPGRIQTIEVKEGQQVALNDVVATISIPEISAKLEQVKAKKAQAQAKEAIANTGARPQQLDAVFAQRQRAKAGFDLSKATYMRIASLFKDGLVSKQKYDEARAQYLNAKNQFNAAQAQYSLVKEGARTEEKMAAIALVEEANQGVAEVKSLADESSVKSPVAGEVTRIVMHPGEIIPPGFPIMTVVDLSHQWVSFNVREDDLSQLKQGTTLKAYIPGIDKTIDLSVYYLSARGEFATWRATRQNSGYDIRTFEVRAKPTQPVEGLRPGMSAIVER